MKATREWCGVEEGWASFGSGIYFWVCERDRNRIECLDLETHQFTSIYKLSTPVGDFMVGLFISLTTNTCSTRKPTSNPIPWLSKLPRFT